MESVYVLVCKCESMCVEVLIYIDIVRNKCITLSEYIYIYMCVCVCVCLDLLTYTREEMNLYLKKCEQCVSECLQRKECVSKYSCVCYKDV
jgi:hypothetical protein